MPKASMPMPKAPEMEDLSLALGEQPPGEMKGNAGSGYLDSKPAELRSYLESAVDTAGTPESRAEALCRAIEFTRNGGGEESAEEELDEEY
jgi:hypothetical protein